MRFFFSHSVVTSPGCSASSRRDEQLRELVGLARSVERRAIGTSTWIPSAPLVFTYDASSSPSSAPRIRCATRTQSANAVGLVRRVEVEEDEVGPVGLVDPRVPRVHVDAVHLHHPEERVARVDEREVDETRARPRAATSGTAASGSSAASPSAPASGRTLPPGEPLAPALHRERPVAQVRHDRRRDRVVVVEQVALRDPVVREEDAVGARQLDPQRASESRGVSRSISRAITSRWIWFVPS